MVSLLCLISQRSQVQVGNHPSMWAISLGRPATKIAHFERMGVDRFSSNSLISTKEQAFRGRERDSLLAHAYYHTLAHSPFSFLSFTLLFFFYLLCFSCPFFHSFLFSLILPHLCIVKALFYIARHDGFLLFCPLTTFVLVQVSFPEHPLVCQLPSHHHFLVLVVPHPIPKQKSFILFSCSPWHSHSNKGGHSLLLSLMACTQ